MPSKEDDPVDLCALIRAPDLDWDAIRNDPEIRAYARQIKKDEEVADIESFLAAYPRATGETLDLENIGESPDAVCSRPDGTCVGVEITTIRRSPDQAFWEGTFYHTDEMDPDETLEEISRLIFQKAELRPQFSQERTILVLAICESDFRMAVGLAKLIPLEDLEETGFVEIWLADFKGIRDGAHREVRVFGLYPKHLRTLTGRSIFDQKPYG